MPKIWPYVSIGVLVLLLAAGGAFWHLERQLSAARTKLDVVQSQLTAAEATVTTLRSRQTTDQKVEKLTPKARREELKKWSN